MAILLQSILAAATVVKQDYYITTWTNNSENIYSLWKSVDLITDRPILIFKNQWVSGEAMEWWSSRLIDKNAVELFNVYVYNI